MRLITTILFVFFAIALVAQSTISGTITDEVGDPLIGVTIFEKGNEANGTVTDIDGTFSINVSDPNAKIEVSYIGYLTKKISLSGNKKLDVILQSNTEQLNEVVVVGPGIKRQKRNLGYSTETFKGDELEKSNAPNIAAALSGKSAGVQVTSGNGVDGGTTRITIRGNNNITGNNQPLIIVDGVPLQNEPGLEAIGRGIDWGSALNNINPNDIASYVILKGPTAAAKYGSRGSNGVILITTKRGKKQKGIGVNYSLQYKTVQPYRYRDVQNEYGAGGPVSLLEPTFQTDAEGTLLYPNSVHSDNGPFGRATTETFGFYSTGASWGPRMEGQMIRWWDGEMRAFSPQPDNMGLYFSNGNSATHNLSFSGGSEMGTMRVSMTRTDNTAIIPNSNFDQNTINLGSNLNISDKVKADLSVSYINYNRLNSPTLGDAFDSFGKGIIYSYPRSYKGIDKDLSENADGSQNSFGGTFPFTYIGSDLWWNTYHNNKTLRRNKLIGALTLTYDITDWLSAMGRVGTDLTFQRFETRNDPIDNLGILEGKYETEIGEDIVRNNEFLITARKETLFNKPLSASISVGGTQWSRNQYGLKAASGDWVNPSLFALNNFGDRNTVPAFDGNTEARFNKRINSAYAFVNLGWSNYFFVELSGRNDWSSSLPIDNNSYFYPAASVSFIPTEYFERGQDWLTFWKIRGAYAKTANDTDPFQVDFIYETGNFGGNQTATLPGTIPPIALRPQQANSYELGTNIGLFDNNIDIDFTYYYIRSFDQILDSPTPNSSGASKIRINSGVLENKGIEAIVNFNLIRKRNLTLKTGFNFARNRNKVVSLGDGAKLLELADIWGLNGPAIAVREGEDYGTIIGYDHIYHENGEPILNEEGTHYLFTESRVPIGNASPDFTGGWTTQLTYKNFRLSTLVDTKWGGDIYAGSYVIGLQTGQSPETLIERNGGGLPYVDPNGDTRNIGVILDGVYADGSQNDKVVHYYFKYVPNAGGWGRWLSTPGILDNSWVKLREVSLSYDFPTSLTRKTKVFQNLTLSVVGRDLFYLYASLPDNINPEGANGAGNAQGLEWGAFPGVRSFGVNLNCGF